MTSSTTAIATRGAVAIRDSGSDTFGPRLSVEMWALR